MNEFLEKIKSSYGHKNADINMRMDSIDNFQLNDLECIYLFDFSKNKIFYHKGFEKVFGYKQKILDLDFVFDKYHPEDALFVKAIVKATVAQLMKITIPEFSNVLSMSYRFRNLDGSYKNILSSTIVHQTDDKDRILSVLIKYTDISFTTESDAVEWMVESSYIDEDAIKQQVYGEANLVFTNREIEVIGRMFKGETNDEIAKNLYISRHTVATHRKNILLKSACADIKALKSFCKKKGIEI